MFSILIFSQNNVTICGFSDIHDGKLRFILLLNIIIEALNDKGSFHLSTHSLSVTTFKVLLNCSTKLILVFINCS